VNDITGLVLTFNEASNIARTLHQLTWLRSVVVVDSLSSDDTVEIASRFSNVRVVARAFTTHAEQWNYGLQDTAIDSDWVLALDADYVLTDDVIREIQLLDANTPVSGFRAAFDYCIDGVPLRGAAYPPVTVLFRRSRARYEQDGHTQRVRIDGDVRDLKHRIQHDDRKSLRHWLGAQARYMALEAAKLSAPHGALGWPDRLRKWVVVAPPAMFAYCYFLRGGILDGKAGLFYALQRATSELILSMFLVRRAMSSWPGARTAPGGPAGVEAGRE
jgi:glycosyltransferase involved in cell wall biosynthesis